MYEIQFKDLKSGLDRFGLDRRCQIYHIGTSKEVCDIIQRLPKDILFTLREYDLDSVEDVLKDFENNEV